MELQLDWNVDGVTHHWTAGPDTAFLLDRVSVLAPQVAAAGEPRRVLEVRRPRRSMRVASACAASKPS